MPAGHTPSLGKRSPLNRKAHGLFRSVFIYISSDSCVHSSCLFSSQIMLLNHIHGGFTELPELGSLMEKNESSSLRGKKKTQTIALSLTLCFLFNKEPWKPCLMSIANLKAGDYYRWQRWKPREPTRHCLFRVIAGLGVIGCAYFVFQLNVTGGEHNTCLCTALILSAGYLSLPFFPRSAPAWNAATAEEG